MSDGLTVTIDLRAFERDMKQLGGPLGDKIAMRAMHAGGEVVLDALMDTVPERPDLPSGTALAVGELGSDLHNNVSKQAGGPVVARIGPGKKTRHVAAWVEYGHEGASAGKRRFLRESGNLAAKFVPAHPWIRVALETSQDEAIAVAGFVLQSEIAKEFARLGYAA